jgi:hypothetical protein
MSWDTPFWGNDTLSTSKRLKYGWFGIALNTTTGAITRRGDGEFQPVSSSGNSQYIGDWASKVLEDLSPVVLTDNGVEYKEISKFDVTRHTDNTVVDQSGGNGQIMVRLPVHYYRLAVIGIYYILDFSDQPLPGFTISPATPNGFPAYIGMYEASRVPSTTKLSSISKDPRDSISPVWPITERASDEWGVASGGSITYFQALATARGTGWTCVKTLWWVMHYLIHVAAYGTLNTDFSVGTGRTTLSGGSWVRDSDGSNTGYIGRCGLSNPLAGRSANVTTGFLTSVSRMLWVENQFGNIWKAMPDCLVDAQNAGAVKMMIKTAPPYSEVSLTGYSALKDFAGNDVLLPSSGGYQGVPNSGLAMFLSSVSSGNSSSWAGDYAYIITGSGLRGLLVGGGASAGAYAGGVYRTSDYAPSISDASIGSRLGFQAA